MLPVLKTLKFFRVNHKCNFVIILCNMKTLELSNICKHEITNNFKKNIKKAKSKALLMYLCVILLFVVNTGINTLNIVKNYNIINNPVNSLYNDNSDAVFTNNDKLLNFVIPIKGAISNIEDDGSISFVVNNSIMVCATESGVVEDVGSTNDYVKYVKIKHTDGIYSILENLDLVGVCVGEIVKSGQDIATAKVGTRVVFKLFDNGTQITNLKLIQSKIVWQD